MYVGFGPALSHNRPGPVYTQEAAETEVGGALVVAYDLRATARIAIRGAWWNYFLAPGGESLGALAMPTTVAWDTHVALGMVLSFGSPTVRRPPKTFTR
jgi:hypothetical protein